jgi:hypothetical protein
MKQNRKERRRNETATGEYNRDRRKNRLPSGSIEEEEITGDRQKSINPTDQSYLQGNRGIEETNQSGNRGVENV